MPRPRHGIIGSERGCAHVYAGGSARHRRRHARAAGGAFPAALFPQQQIDAILFGSYARGDAEDGSDIDVMFLVDAPRQDIARQHWRIGEAAAEILLERGVLVSPVVEERAYYERNADVLPFFRNVRREGVAIHG